MASALSTSESGAVQIKDVLTCFICKQDNSSTLLQLNCFHVCHKNCLKKSLRNARPGSKFNCDECKTTNILPTNGVEGLLEEVLQYKMKEIAAIFSNVSPPCNICEGMGEECISSHFCITCKMHLCQTDTKRHKPLPDHTIITNAETQTEQYLPRILSSKKALCSTHSTEDSAKTLEFYCQQCQMPTCQACCITDHRQRKIISLQEASGKLKEELKRRSTEIPNKRDQCDIVVHKLEQILNVLEENSKVQIEKCHKWGEDVKKVIDKIVNENVQNIEKITQAQKNHIMKKTEEKKYQNKQFQSAKDYTEVFLRFGSNSDFLQKHKLFIENLQNCLQQEVGVSFDTEEFEVQLKDVKEIEKTVKEMLREETVYRTHQVEGQPQLTGCTLESKWETDEAWRGLAVEGEDVIAVKGKRIEVYDMNGERKGQIKCQELGWASRIEVMHGQIFVSESEKTKRQILAIDRNGRVVRKLCLPAQENRFDQTLGLAVNDNTEDIYIASSGTNTVYKFSKEQTIASPFITRGLNKPLDLCITSNHEVIVSNWGSHKVSKYSSEGTLLWEYGQEGTREGQFEGPSGVCADPYGNVFVCDYLNKRIHHLSSDGKFLSFIKIREEIVYPWAITWNKEKLIVSSWDTPPKIIVIKCQYKVDTQTLVFK